MISKEESTGVPDVVPEIDKSDSMSTLNSEIDRTVSSPSPSIDQSTQDTVRPDCGEKRTSILRANLSAGFESLTDSSGTTARNKLLAPITKQASEQQSIQSGWGAGLTSCVTVNFIDPTTRGNTDSGSNSAHVASLAQPRRRGWGAAVGPISAQLTGLSSLNVVASPSSSASASSHPNQQLHHKPQFPHYNNPNSTNKMQDLYSKLTTILSRDYDATLNSVPIPNMRTGSSSTIDRIPIRCVLVGGGSREGYDADAAWGGSAAGGTAPVSDPAEWHIGPYCHVYIAACESLEHYRSKVRPSLQAFVSQIEGAGSGNEAAAISAAAANSSGKGVSGAERMEAAAAASMAAVAASNASGGNYSCQYLIVYVPTQGSSGGEYAGSAVSTDLREKVGLRAKIAAGRRALQSQDSLENFSVSGLAVGGPVVDALGAEEMPAEPQPGPLTHASKNEKDLLRKFTSDFPNGRTVILSTLLDSNNAATASPLRNQEWNAFLRALGDAIVCGFRDRTRRYNEELRRLDSRRSSLGPLGMPSPTVPRAQQFDLSHFFLVKESLAFTYEQMQLLEEALLQYEELEAFVPDGNWVEEEELLAKERRKQKKLVASGDGGKAGTPAATVSVADMAAAGDTVGFRRRIRATTDITTISHLVKQYLFAREVNLLFQLRKPVEVIRRSFSCICDVYWSRLESTEQAKTAKERAKKRAEAESWALASCWDVKLASDRYFVFGSGLPKFSRVDQHGAGINETNCGDLTGVSPEAAPTEEERAAARNLSDLLSFGRSRLLKLGDTELPCENPIRKAMIERPADTLTPWLPWNVLRKEHSCCNVNLDDRKKQFVDTLDDVPTEAHPSGADIAHKSDILPKFDSSWLRGSFSSKKAFEAKHMALSSAIASLNGYCGRLRFAARLLGEQAEILMLQGEYQKAAETLLPVVDSCAYECWDMASYWRLFRLCCCQRMTGDAPSYLDTLTRCLDPRFARVAPPKTTELLQQDLEAVAGDSEIAKKQLGMSLFLETELAVAPTSLGRQSQALSLLRKKLIMNFCLVGDTVSVELGILSHLPRTVTIDSIRLILMTLEQYEKLHQERGMITEGDGFCILTIEGPIALDPGHSVHNIEWIPMTVGQYVFASVGIKWKEALFFHDSAVLRRPMIGVEVLPSEPTQTVELNPLFLIPGHIQQVRLVFYSGSDIVKGGNVELTCSKGLQILPPGVDSADDAWRDTCSLTLDPCEADSTIVLTTTVKSEPIAIDNHADPTNSHGTEQATVQTMQVKVNTSYYHSLYDETSRKGEDAKISPMTTLLEAMVTTLDRPALTVGFAGACLYAENEVMVNVILHCNAPVPFFLKEWEISLLPPLSVAKNGDLNKGLFGYSVIEGEELFFNFKCVRTDDRNYTLPLEHDRSILHVVLKDAFGKTFRQVLPLDLDSFYEQMWEEDELTVTNVAMAELKCSNVEGVVGAPVQFTYSVDASVLLPALQGGSAETFSEGSSTIMESESIPSLTYSISCTATDWILGGKVQGPVDCSFDKKRFSCDFVGIPTRSGVLKQFPELSLDYHHLDAYQRHSAIPITVQTRFPESFKSLSYSYHMALACSTAVDV